MRVGTGLDKPMSQVKRQFCLWKAGATYIIGGRSSRYLLIQSSLIKSIWPDDQIIPICRYLDQPSLLATLKRLHPGMSFGLVIDLRPRVFVAEVVRLATIMTSYSG